jgi:hypothetical protein
MDIDDPTPDQVFRDQLFAKLQELETIAEQDIASRSFRESFGRLIDLKIGDQTVLNLLFDMAADKLKGKENNSFDGELQRLQRILGKEDSRLVPSTGQELMKWIRTFLIDPFVATIPIVFCENGAALAYDSALIR